MKGLKGKGVFFSEDAGFGFRVGRLETDFGDVLWGGGLLWFPEAEGGYEWLAFCG